MAFDEVPIERLTEYTSLFPGPQLALLTQSVFAGNTVARLWITGGVRRPDVAVLWDFGNKGIYVGGAPAPAHSSADLRSFLLTDLMTVARAAGLKHLKVRALLPQLVDRGNTTLGEAMLKSRTKLFHECSAEPATATITTPLNVQLVSIDRSLIGSGMVGCERVVSEVKSMWPSVDRFLAHGWGVAAVVAGQVVSWCTAEFVGPSQCGIGIETMPDYRNNGIATATANRFIEESVRRRRNPCWECDSENTASLRVAEKLGFRLTESTDWLVGSWGW